MTNLPLHAEIGREQRELDKRYSDIDEAGDFLVGLVAGIGLSALIVIALWSLFL